MFGVDCGWTLENRKEKKHSTIFNENITKKKTMISCPLLFKSNIFAPLNVTATPSNHIRITDQS